MKKKVYQASLRYNPNKPEKKKTLKLTNFKTVLIILCYPVAHLSSSHTSVFDRGAYKVHDPIVL